MSAKLVKRGSLTFTAIVLLIAMTLLSCHGENQEMASDSNPPKVEVITFDIPNVYQVKVGGISFTENLSGCNNNCSPVFYEVPAGTNEIVLYSTNFNDARSLGTLGPFLEGKYYTVRVSTLIVSFCATLWKRFQTDTDFYNDSTKEVIGGIGYCEHVP